MLARSSSKTPSPFLPQSCMKFMEAEPASCSGIAQEASLKLSSPWLRDCLQFPADKCWPSQRVASRVIPKRSPLSLHVQAKHLNSFGFGYKRCFCVSLLAGRCAGAASGERFRCIPLFSASLPFLFPGSCHRVVPEPQRSPPVSVWSIPAMLLSTLAW